MSGYQKPTPTAGGTEYPGLSKKERNRRWQRVRELMRDRGLACLLVFGLKGREQFDRYLTNDRTGGIVVFPLEGDLVHLTWTVFDVVAHLESALRDEESWVRDIRVGATGDTVVKVLREKGFDRAAIGTVGLTIYGAGEREGYVPYKTWSCILDNLPQADFQEISTAFAQLVAVKSTEELQLVRRAAEIGELAAEAMLQATRPGASESEVYTAAMSQLFLHGANGSTSPYISPMILHSGPDNPSWGAPMWLFRGQPPRVLKKGDIIQAEIFPRYGGLEAQLQMSVALEPLDPVNRKCADIARRSYVAGFKALCPGAAFGDVVHAMEEPLRQAGAWHLTPLVHSLNPLSWVSGTGVGIENMPGIEKYKGIGPSPVIGADVKVQPSTVWVLEPNACLGRHRVNIGGTVVVTENGPESLNVLPNELRMAAG
ncbi:MAG: M24 family metallopeptidase [Desulfobacterales bacterium]|nr:M24 family metallopeptidase [Desulfobacterales bacterium]